MMQCVDYAYYIETFCGAAIPEREFTRLSRQAFAYLQSVTMGKIRGKWLDDTRVKDACCAIAETMQAQEQGGEVASESNDGTSVTYVNSGMTSQQQLYNAAFMYLASTGLLYAGVL